MENVYVYVYICAHVCVYVRMWMVNGTCVLGHCEGKCFIAKAMLKLSGKYNSNDNENFCFLHIMSVCIGIEMGCWKKGI